MESSTFLIVRGAISITLGVLAMAWPGITIAALVGIFALYAILDGTASLVLGPGRSHGGSWAHVLQGVVGVAAGVLTIIWPDVTALALVLFIGAWAVVTGALELVAAVRLRKVIKGEWLLALSGVLSLIFGALVFAFPAAGAISIAWLLGIYAVAAGLVLVTLGLRLRTSVQVAH
jgi:uncharacterized membrane protein HdeD (DUF308 family)